MAAKGERGKDFMSQKWGARDDLKDISQELKDQLKTYDKIDDIVNKTLKVESLSLAASKSAGDINSKTNKKKLKSHKLDAEALDMDKEELMEEFMIAYQDSLLEIGLDSREIARMALAALV